MSLNRVSSLETLIISNSRRESNASVIHATKLSFNPSSDHHHDAPTTSAATVAKWKKIIQVISTVIYCLLAAGIVFGFAALKPVLKEEGAYRMRCSSQVESHILLPADFIEEEIDTCVELRLNLMFTAAAVSTNVAALPIGTFLDRFGPRSCAIIGSVFLAIGSLLLAHAQTITWLDAYFIGYLFLALGGPATFISSFHLSNAFPSHSGLVLALLTGAFDSSSAVFLVYRILYERSGGTIGLDRFFLGYLAVPVSIFLCHLTIMPTQSYQTVGEKVFSEIYEHSEALPHHDHSNECTALLRDEILVNDIRTINDEVEREIDIKVNTQKCRNEKSGVVGILHGLSAWQQIKTPWFILICIFTVIQMLRLNYFMATIRTQYSYLLGSDDAARTLNQFFDIALPLGGIVAIPFVGIVLDRLSCVFVLSCLAIGSSVIGILGLIPHSMTAGVANICIFVLFRPFYYTAISDYAGKVFGYSTFGTVYGALICIAGLCNLLQGLLDYVFERLCNGNPFLVNLGLFWIGLVADAVLIGYVWIQVGRRKGTVNEAISDLVS